MGPEGADDHRSPTRIREVYNDIAAHFSKTRAHPWPEVEAFLDDSQPGGVGLDVGCGNGRHLEVLAGLTEQAVGVDLSRGILREAHARLENDAALVQGDAAALPIGSGRVDIALYVAAIHHLPDREARRGSLNELARILAPDGCALVSAWSTAHDSFDAPVDADEGFDTTVDWTLPDGETVPRFYHIYAPTEFDADLAASALTVEETTISSGNCYARVRSERKRP
ncbi:MAG: class I SAM-dependent methyltransferase [Haloarculaceae archaeon]